MPLWLGDFLKGFIPLFVAVDPIGLAVIFLTMSRGVPETERKKISRQAAVTAGIVALLFLFLGEAIFAAVGITARDFEIAGGLILFVLAARDLLQSPSEPEKFANDFGVVPLGMPLIAGPAMIATLLIIVKSVGLLMSLAALVANLVIVVLVLAYAANFGRLIGQTGMRAVSKIISILLAAIAVAMIRRGLAG